MLNSDKELNAMPINQKERSNDRKRKVKQDEKESEEKLMKAPKSGKERAAKARERK